MTMKAWVPLAARKGQVIHPAGLRETFLDPDAFESTGKAENGFALVSFRSGNFW
jgi:hypothetical protein